MTIQQIYQSAYESLLEQSTRYAEYIRAIERQMEQVRIEASNAGVMLNINVQQ